jgi:hypothetical protein
VHLYTRLIPRTCTQIHGGAHREGGWEGKRGRKREGEGRTCLARKDAPLIEFEVIKALVGPLV